MDKLEIINQFWYIYQTKGSIEAIEWIQTIDYVNSFYENYQNTITTDNVLNDLLSNMKLK